MRGCSAIKPDGERCRAIAATGSDYCPAHDPARAGARKRAASKAARSKGGSARGELAQIRTLLQWASYQMTLPENPEEAREQGKKPRTISRADAAVLGQLCNVRLRLIETERKLIDQDEILSRIENLERLADEGPRRRYGS